MIMSDGRRLRVRDQGSTKSVQRIHKKVRSRLSSISASNEDSTDAEDDTVVACSGVKSGGGSVVKSVPIKDTNISEKGLRSFRRKSKVGTSLAERDVIDGFLILSFASYQDLEKEVKESEDPLAASESEIFAEPPHQSDAESKDEEGDEARHTLEKLESLLNSSKKVVNGYDKMPEDKTTAKPKIHVEVPVREKSKEVIFTPSKEIPFITSQLSVKVVKVKTEAHHKIICDTAEEEKKVPPDLEPPESEIPKREDAQTPNRPPSSPFPLKSPHFLSLQNGSVQQPEPSAAVAAVTVTASPTVPSSSQLGPSSNPTPLPSSTSPAGGVPFPSSLLNQEEFTVSPTVVSTSSSKSSSSPVLGSSKSYDSSGAIVKPHRSEVALSLPYPICSSYSDYTVNYATSQYSSTKHHSSSSYDSRETSQRSHHQQKVVANNNYYHHHHQQQLDKYAKESLSRNSSSFKVDGYNSSSSKVDSYSSIKNSNESFLVGNNFESSKSNSNSSDLNYCVGQVYATSNEKPCDPQYVYAKKATSNNVLYGYKTNELLNTTTSSSQSENAVKSTASDKPKIVNESYSSVSKAKVPNRTTYYQSIVNKTHSRHKSSRRVLPASAYENPKPVINNNNYSSTKPELLNVQGSKYSSQHYSSSSDTKKPDYYQPVTTTATHTVASSYSYSNHKSDSQQPHISNNNNSTSQSVWNDSSYTNSRNYNKVNLEQCSSSYREKQVSNAAYNPITKSYNYYPSSKSYSDARSKQDPSLYTNSDYYQKGSVAYSRSGATHDVYKNSNHISENANYSGKNGAYQHSRTLSDKTRNYYSNNPEGSYKTHHSESVPKQSAEDPHGYKIHNDSNAYSSYGNSNSLNKPKEVVSKSLEVPKPVPHEQSNVVDTNSSVHPPIVCEASSYYPPSSSKDKNNYYPHSDPPHFVHRRTPPLPPSSKPQTTSFESLKLPPKDTESFRISSTTTAISSYSQRPLVSSSPSYENSRSVVKTLWSPTANTPTVTNAPSREIITASSRDSHSSHSNSSISSLSQLSQSLGSGAATTSQQSSKDYPREGRSSSNGHSRCSSRDETPVCSATALTTASLASTTTATTTTAAAYGVSGSLTSLIFSKPSWTSPSVSTVLTHPSSHFTPSSSGRVASPVPSVLPLAPSLPGNSPFGPHPAGPHVMFAPPLPASGSLSSPSLPSAAAGPAPFGSESLLVPPNQDLLRRELDTRFLASQDRSINVPPPPYLRTEMHQHQHQHTHMHQHSPFLPPPIGGSLLPPSAAHLYDKFPKVDSGFYGRSALGLPGYPSLSPLLAPGSATATPTPFAPPGHLAAFQPKISPLVKAKTMKSGRWCAMHVRISWEIYHHQQKQQAESQKGGNGGSSSAKTVPDLLRPPNHLFGSLPRPHELGFSSPLLSSATSLHARSPYDVSSQHPSFLGPSPAHLGMTPFARPTYPGLGMPGNSFGGLGSLAGLAGAGMLAGRDLGPGYLSIGQDPWSRLHRTPPNFPSPSAMNPSSWGGLKAEAERDRLQRREEQDQKEKLKKAEAEKREGEKSKEIKEKREQEKQKERDRESRVVTHLSHSAESLRNGESSERTREWERSRERRDSSRSPIRSSSTHKTDSFEGNHHGGGPHHYKQQDVKVKEEKREELLQREERNKESSPGSDRERNSKSNEPPPSGGSLPPDLPPSQDYHLSSRSGLLSGLGAPLSSAEARLTGAIPPPPPHFWNPLPPSSERSLLYRGLELHQRMDPLEQQQLMQKYAALSSAVMPGLVPGAAEQQQRYREAELARHLSSSEAAVERQLQAAERQAYKLPPPPLRPNDPPYVTAPGLPAPFNPFLNSLCASYPPRTTTKPGSPGGMGNGIPPPLIPCVSSSQGGSPVMTGSTTPSPLHLKMGGGTTPSSSSAAEANVGRDYANKDRGATEIESQSR